MGNKAIYFNEEQEDYLKQFCRATGRKTSAVVQEAVEAFKKTVMQSRQSPTELGHRINREDNPNMLGFKDVLSSYSKALGAPDAVCICGAGWLVLPDGSYQPVNLEATKQCRVYGGNVDGRL